jgi:hypothetical protein
METEKRLKYVGVIMNAWLYGVEDTANLFFDKPKLFYRKWGAIAIKPFIESWNDLGIEFQKGLSPYNTSKMFIEALVKSNFMNEEDFDMCGDDNKFLFSAIRCPYKEHCGRLSFEKKELACLRAITLLGAMDFNKEGDSQKYKYDFDFVLENPCTIVFEKFKD